MVECWRVPYGCLFVCLSKGREGLVRGLTAIVLAGVVAATPVAAATVAVTGVVVVEVAAPAPQQVRVVERVPAKLCLRHDHHASHHYQGQQHTPHHFVSVCLSGMDRCGYKNGIGEREYN